ncbi:MAG TPA: DNA polymerase/3'-5' exonuclease PolX [Caulobacteraceae bacterium]|nr:DNA polymerase/3'-5' exonuclease PolX [Caulobacteraceae bacterium]
MRNADVAAVFNHLADLLEIEEANRFRVRAYRRAAATLEELPESVETLVRQGRDLTELPGVGEDLAGKIREIVETGRCRMLDEVEARTPSSLAALTSIPGLGPKRVQTLFRTLGVRTLEQLAAAAKAGRLRDLPRFGATLEAKVAEALARKAAEPGRIRLATAEDFAKGLLAHMRGAPGLADIAVAGSFRRRKETVGDLDLLVSTTDPQAAIDRFTGYDEAEKVTAKGPTRAQIVLRSGLQVDLRAVEPQSWGAALHYFTGSKGHNIAIRQRGQARGLKINEYGVFRGEARIGGRTEAEVFAAVGLPFIPPELREDLGEIDAAERGRLPKLIERADLRGDLHVHTRASDGKNTLAEMAKAAQDLGYEYLAITDHSRHATIAHGLDPKRLSAQIDEVRRWNDAHDGLRLLASCEVDILADGSLDLPDSLLKRLDLVVGAVHFRFDLDARAQTERILKAMDNPLFSVLAHPTGRLIGERPAYDLDLDRVLEGARDRGCAVELNAHPSRLDLDDVHCRAAKALGLKVVIATDAHSTLGLGAIGYGVDQARRGWLEAKDVLNTRPLANLKRLLAR